LGDIQRYIPVVGEPVAFGIGFLVLVLVAFAGGVADSLVTVVHEGGHMVTALLFGQSVVSLKLEGKEDRVEAETTRTRAGGGVRVSDIVIKFIGYPAPPLAGLGGAYVIADGNAWGVLAIGVVLLLAVLLVESNALATVIILLALGGLIWAILAGGPRIQAAVAVGLVWLLLIGGLRRIVLDGTRADDAIELSGWTWIPRFVWVGLWLIIGVISLWVGARVILGL
jgi:hypothetical protein